MEISKHGQSGIETSELLPNLAEIIDDVCLIRSMHTGERARSFDPLFSRRHSGIVGRPTLGSWLVYGLGCESQELPAYLVLTDPAGLPVDGVSNWSNGFMPPVSGHRAVRRASRAS